MWFNELTGIYLGAFGGAAIGVLGGAWGTMAGIFASKGKLKRLVLTFALALIITGAISLCTGITALITRQPYHVWYPFALIGGILTAVLIPNYFIIKNIYKKSEMKKMNIEDLT
jgi:hypothetical protein